MRTILRRSPTALLVLAVVLLSPSGVRAQQAVQPKRVLVLYWDDRDHPANIEFERDFQAAVRSAAPGPIEFYSEYLESNRFPGESQSELLRDYIKQKYRDRTIDVVVPNARAPLEFLFKYRNELFPNTPIVFSATSYPTAAQLKSQAGATGIVFVSTYRKTLDLALRLHPGTEQVFVVSGTMTHDRTWENLARSQLNGYESSAAITYLTDLPLKELIVKLKNLPKRSIVLYIWQQALDEQGRRLESHEVFKLIAPSTNAPIYGMSFRYIGLGMVGGYVWTREANTARLAQMTLKVAYGARASDIPAENAPDTPMFDWGQVRWWNIPEDRLPKNSVIRFRELPLWPKYKWYVIGAIGLIELETLLIGMLLIQRRRAREGAAALVKTQAVLRESEERFRRVFEEGPLGLALVGKNYHFWKVNRALCRMVGYSEAELLQRSFVDITHPDDVQADVELAERLFRSAIPYKIRKRYLKKNGEIIWIDMTGSVIRDQEGEVMYGLAMIEDITEFKRTQEEALARHKLESLGVLAGGIAHDFNNLLGSILASTELALTERADGSAVDEELQRIKTTSIRGAEIVQALMIYGGKESPTVELLDMSALVNEMLELLKVSISKHTILKIELGQDLPPIRANAAQIRQVVMNLVTNASEAIGERTGEIRVTCGKVKVGPDSPPPGGVDLAEGDYVRLAVCDTGGGITPEMQARIFDPFFSTKRTGRGLGLAAVQGIIRSHGGTINVESAPGQGSRFEILLPCIDQAVRKPKDITASPSTGEAGSVAGTVLVVEDEETLRLAVLKMLRRVGFSVIEAGDGTAGVNLFRANEHKINVVLLDMTLPGMSGREVLAELRRIQPGVKVILTSAFSQGQVLSSIAEQHLWGYVRKPYQLSELTSLLRMACLDEPKITGHAAG